jgi:hypothetical protein
VTTSRSIGARVAAALVLAIAAGSGAAADMAGSEPALVVDSPLVGAWEIYLPNAVGAAHWVFEFRPDGTYTLHAPVYGHSGAYAVPAPGLWTLQATTTAFADHGAFGCGLRTRCSSRATTAPASGTASPRRRCCPTRWSTGSGCPTGCDRS